MICGQDGELAGERLQRRNSLIRCSRWACRAPPGGQRLGRVDVGDRGLARHLDLADEIGMLADQVLGAADRPRA